MLTLRQTANAAWFARERLGFTPDAEQERLLATQERYVILNCHRQWGKTTVTAIRAVHQAVMKPRQEVVVVSTTLRQALAPTVGAGVGHADRQSGLVGISQRIGNSAVTGGREPGARIYGQFPNCGRSGAGVG